MEKINQLDTNLVTVEKKKAKEDLLKINEKKFNDFLNSVPDNIQQKYERQIKKFEDSLIKTISDINSRLDHLMKIWDNDEWLVKIKDGEDTKYLLQIAEELNNLTKLFISSLKEDNQLSINLFSLAPEHKEKKFLSIWVLKEFLSKLNHSKKNTIENIPTNPKKQNNELNNSNNIDHNTQKNLSENPITKTKTTLEKVASFISPSTTSYVEKREKAIKDLLEWSSRVNF